MEVSPEKGQTMTNSTNDISTDISMNGEKLNEMISFKHLGTTQYRDGTWSTEIRVAIASSTAAMARLKRIRRNNAMNLASKFPKKWLWKLHRISDLEHETNDYALSKINFLVGPQEPVSATVKRRKLTRFRHVTRDDSLSIHLHFFQNLSRVFPVLAVANTVSRVGQQNKIDHPAGCRFPC